jgi:hypothetical protein
MIASAEAGASSPPRLLVKLIWQMLGEGRLRAVKLGRLTRFPVEHLRAFVNSSLESAAAPASATRTEQRPHGAQPRANGTHLRTS